MGNIFDVIFYKFFQHSKKIGNVNDDNFYAFKAIAIFAVFLFFNVFTLWFLYKIIVGTSHFKAPPIFISVLFLIVIAGGLYMYYLRGDNYKRRIEYIQRYPKSVGAKGSRIVIVYMIFSVLTPLIMALMVKASH